MVVRRLARSFSLALSLGMALAWAAPAVAADLGGDEYPPQENYREPRYSEADRPPPPPYYERERAPAYEPGPYDRYADRGGGRGDGSCIPRWRIRKDLLGDGWTDLEPIDRGGPTVMVRARRAETGRIFLLDVDRCSGEIVNARRDRLRSFGAYGPPGWRRSYY